MTPERLGEVVAVAVGGVRVLPREVACGLAKSAAICGVSCHSDRRQNTAIAVVEESVAAEVAAANVLRRVNEGDVVGGVVGHKLVDQRRRGGVGEVKHHVDSR